MCQHSRHCGKYWGRRVGKCDKCYNRGSTDRLGTHRRESGIDSGMESCTRKLIGELPRECRRTYKEERKA